MEDKQLLMENKIKEILTLLAGEDRRNDVEKMMNPYFIRCNYEEKSLTIGYDVAEWELNPQGVMHGGMITTAFDNAFGILTHFFAQESFITTVELGVHFHKPVYLGDKIEIAVKANHLGRTLAGYTGELRAVNRDIILAASATTTFIILNGKTSEIFDNKK